MGRRTGGLLVMWDERRFVMQEKRVLVTIRLIKIKLQDVVAGEVLTIIAAYLPTRDKADSTIVPIWNTIHEHGDQLFFAQDHRPRKLRLWELDKTAWTEYAKELFENERLLHEVATCSPDPAAKLGKLQDVLVNTGSVRRQLRETPAKEQGGCRSPFKLRELKTILLDSTLSAAQRRERIIELCAKRRDEAARELRAYESREGEEIAD
ncbi:MAG: hypothetical protein SGPRY_004328 [Prymnesium sp.]